MSEPATVTPRDLVLPAHPRVDSGDELSDADLVLVAGGTDGPPVALATITVAVRRQSMSQETQPQAMAPVQENDELTGAQLAGVAGGDTLNGDITINPS